MSVEMKSRHGRAVALMVAGVGFFSTNGLFVELTFGDNHPFLYNTGVWVGTSLGLGVLLFVLHRPIFSDPVSRRVLFRRSVGLKTDGVRRWDLVALLWLLVVGRFAFAFFGWAIHYVDTATVAVLHYTWPVLFVLVLARWDRTMGERYRKVGAFSWFGLGLAFIGMAAVVVGTVGFDARGTVLAGGVFGIVLTFISALLQAGVATLGFPFAYGVASEISRKTDARLDWENLEFGCLLFVYCAFGGNSNPSERLDRVGYGREHLSGFVRLGGGGGGQFRSRGGPGPKGRPDHPGPGYQCPHLRIAGGGPAVAGAVHRHHGRPPRPPGCRSRHRGGGERVVEQALGSLLSKARQAEAPRRARLRRRPPVGRRSIGRGT